MKIIKALLLLTIVVSVSSCTKDNTDPSINLITANVDGTATSFTTNIKATTSSANDAALTNITAKAADGGTLLITIKGTLVAGKTYSAATTGVAERPLLQYTSGTDIYLNNDAGANAASITVSSVSGRLIEGTFKGDLTTAAVGGGAVKTKALTNGKFTVTSSN